MPIPRREAGAILNALGAGVVPRSGLGHIAVGRVKEVGSLVQNLDQIAEGGSTCRFVIGRFGSGKSFLLQMIRLLALERKFVVADADFTPVRRLCGTDGKGLAMYKELMSHLSTQTRPDGNALPAIVEKWISTVQSSVAAKLGSSVGAATLSQAVGSEILATINSMQELVHGYDFGLVIKAYYEGYISGNDDQKNNAIRWLRGEFSTKSEARACLDVRTIIDDSNYYDYLKVIAKFSHEVGYAGMLICMDEAVNLYKISNRIAREANYERILSILNDSLQGRVGYFGFIIGGTIEFLEDPRRGLFSYEALRSRLVSSRFANEQMRDYSEPVLQLGQLSKEEIYVLLQKVRTIHQEYTAGARPFDDEAILAYMTESLKRMGASEFSTPRDLVRELINVLNLMAQYPEKSWQEIVQGMPAPVAHVEEEVPFEDEPGEADKPSDNPLDRFTTMQAR